jgi:hypothetical protein
MVPLIFPFNHFRGKNIFSFLQQVTPAQHRKTSPILESLNHNRQPTVTTAMRTTPNSGTAIGRRQDQMTK